MLCSFDSLLFKTRVCLQLNEGPPSRQRLDLVPDKTRRRLQHGGLVQQSIQSIGAGEIRPAEAIPYLETTRTMIESKILLMDRQLDKLPPEIRFDEARGGEKLRKLNHEKKRFVDCIKVFVCNLKAEMARLLRCGEGDRASAGDDCRANGLCEIGRAAVRSHPQEVCESRNRLCRPAPVRGPQPHATRNLG